MNLNPRYSEITEEERLRHSERAIKYLYELWRNSQEISQSFTRNLFLVNGGGAIAVLGFKGTVHNMPQGWEFWPLVFFFCGLVFPLLSIAGDFLRTDSMLTRVNNAFLELLWNEIGTTDYLRAQEEPQKYWGRILQCVAAMGLVFFILDAIFSASSLYGRPNLKTAITSKAQKEVKN